MVAVAQLDGKSHNRTWTLSSHPDESAATARFTISVKKAGLVSTWLDEQLRPGSALVWRGAAGEFTPDTSGNAPVLLIAGGIGGCRLEPKLHIPSALCIHDRSRLSVES